MGMEHGVDQVRVTHQVEGAGAAAGALIHNGGGGGLAVVGVGDGDGLATVGTTAVLSGVEGDDAEAESADGPTPTISTS